jgi:hypothetical protein
MFAVLWNTLKDIGNILFRRFLMLEFFWLFVISTIILFVGRFGFKIKQSNKLMIAGIVATISVLAFWVSTGILQDVRWIIIR